MSCPCATFHLDGEGSECSASSTGVQSLQIIDTPIESLDMYEKGLSAGPGPVNGPSTCERFGRDCGARPIICAVFATPKTHRSKRLIARSRRLVVHKSSVREYNDGAGATHSSTRRD